MGEFGVDETSGYPSALDTDATKEEDGTTPANAKIPNMLADAIIKVQTELGLNPSGDFDTVAARLAGLGGLQVHIVTGQTRNTAGVVKISGCPFEPVLVIGISEDNSENSICTGFSDGTTNTAALYDNGNHGNVIAYLLEAYDDVSSNYTRAVCSAINSDGCDLTFTVSGAPRTCNYSIIFLG